MQREQALGPALVIFGVILILVLAVTQDDAIVGMIIGLPLIVAGAVLLVRLSSHSGHETGGVA